MPEAKGRKRRWNLRIRVTRHIKELNDLITEVDEIDRRFSKGNNDEDNKDEFKIIEDLILLQLGRVKQSIADRHMQKLQEPSITAATIRAGRQIEASTADLDSQFARLKDSFNHQRQLRALYSQENLDQKFNDMQVIRLQIEDCKDLINNDTHSTKHITDRCDFFAVMAETNVQPPGELKEWREPTAEEAQHIERWGARDAKFDSMILDVGNAVDRLANIAQDMNAKVRILRDN
eukprot:GHVH01006640.1.p1 GENE.GHVH01006640.1~~GHVH01006640.1.p1  ORF type:complete len:241 (+),score=45.45 GHVH01006640.1:22-723(+)